MPGNKIAVITAEEMKKINWNEVRQNKKYTFNLKPMPSTIDNLAQLEKYL